jgi:flagellar protein FliS
MDLRLRNFYLESNVNSASPGQMLVMLYDALIQQAETAETEIAAPSNPADRSKAAVAISRCIDIITELSSSLKHDFDPTLCGTLSSLYCFFTRELSTALEKSESEKIRAILPLLRNLRTSWSQALKITQQARPVATA